MSTRSSLAVFNADEVVMIEKCSWAQQDTLHHVGMRRPALLDSSLGKRPSKEARELFDQHEWVAEELGRDTVLPLDHNEIKHAD